MCLDKIKQLFVNTTQKNCETRNESLTTSLTECVEKNVEYITQVNDEKLKVETITNTYNKRNTQYNNIKQAYDTLLQNGVPVEDGHEQYWNSKYPKQNIVYNGRWITVNGVKKELNIDVRDYFCEYDSKIPIVVGTTNDVKALNALKWVINNVKYVEDKKTFGEWEYWLMPWETLATRKGDCEDGAILMANIMLKSGVPYWRIRLNAGDVKGGGHSYLTYCRETDNQFVTLDWCYWQNLKEMKNRKLHSEERDYYGIWFSWNQKYAFGKMNTMKRKPKEFKLKKPNTTHKKTLDKAK